MYLNRLELFNFRQFYGKQSIEFGTTEARNICVIHGENGSGKTSILNAFKWAFYATTDFDTGTESIMNEQAVNEAPDGFELHVSSLLNFLLKV